MDITIQLSYERGYCVLFLGKTIYSIIACLQTPLPDFSEWWEWLTRATFEIPFSTKLSSGSQRNFEEGCQYIRQTVTRDIPSRGAIILLVASSWKFGIFSSRRFAICLIMNFSFNVSNKFSFCFFFLLLLKNFCAQAPCKNYGTCQSGFTRKRYRCLCASGFIGHDCEEGDA